MTEALELHVSSSRGRYDLTAAAAGDGVLEVEVLCGNGNGELVAQLSGTVPAADLAVLGRLFSAAAVAAKADSPFSSLEELRAKPA